jgi:hypothetical protein
MMELAFPFFFFAAVILVVAVLPLAGAIGLMYIGARWLGWNRRSYAMPLYKEVGVKEGTVVQYVGVHVLCWKPEWGEPTVGFVEVDPEVDDIKEVFDND